MILLGLGSLVSGNGSLRAHQRAQLACTRDQRRRLRGRLRDLGRRRAIAKDALMGIGGAAWALLWSVQRYAPAKLTCFLYAAQHLQIAAYELLRREASLAGEVESERLVARLLADEQSAARGLADLLPVAADAAVDGRRQVRPRAG